MKNPGFKKNKVYIYILEPVLVAVLTLFFLSVFAFAIFHGEIQKASEAPERIKREAIFEEAVKKGIDIEYPFIREAYAVQYIEWIGGLFRGHSGMNVEDYKSKE
jgi:ABC-type dipeptide/oligopeptide/nickel transport system permease component